MIKRILIVLALCSVCSVARAQFPPIGIPYSVFRDSLLQLYPQSFRYVDTEGHWPRHSLQFDSVILERFCEGTLYIDLDTDSIVRSLTWESWGDNARFLFEHHLHPRLVARYGSPTLTSRMLQGSDSVEYFVTHDEIAELALRITGGSSFSIRQNLYPPPPTTEKTTRFFDPCRHKISALLPSSWVQQPCDVDTVTDTTTLLDVVLDKDSSEKAPVHWLSFVDTLSPALASLPRDSVPKAIISRIIAPEVLHRDSLHLNLSNCTDDPTDTNVLLIPPPPVFEPFSFDGWHGYYIVREYQRQSPSLIAAFVRGKQELEVLMRVPMEMLLLYKPFFLRTIKTIRVEE